MKKLISALSFVVCFILAYSLRAETAGFSRVAIVGDSHVEALGPELYAAFGLEGVSCQFKKERGSKAEGWVGSPVLKRWMTEFDPQIVIVSFGTNEGMSNSSVDHLAASFQALVNQLKNGHNRRIIWITPPPFSKVLYLENVRAALAEVKGIEVPDFSKNTYNENYTGKHLTRPSYWTLADDIRRWLREHP